MITTIPLWKMFIETKGKAYGLAIIATLPVLCAGGALVFLEGLQSGKTRTAIFGLITLCFFGLGTVITFIPGRKYIPGKSFTGYRSKQAKVQKFVKHGFWVIILLAIGLTLIIPSKYIVISLSTIGALISLYHYSKSIKFHEDIDFSTNQYLASSLQIVPGEKVLASYQNFYDDDIQRGSNAFIVTATKLIIASFDGEHWEKLSRELNQITHIGIVGNESETYFVKLVFGDGTDALLRIGLYEKLTSTPALIIKRLLEVIDSSLLGDHSAAKASQRRRVIAPQGAIQAPTPPVESETAAPPRNIEISPPTLNDIRNAEEIKPGRKLEL
ncbi:hypothetical protein [Pseudomonas protegens]|uniref:Uncharacterized protein n=1 Tax=Pseudomonas protegens TaxID=380021 RepID=A0A9Q6IET6_9PSED|nr:hypothetical protein [Pseudomonas protegens]PYC36257.1 hypothetical protein DMX08_14660 [Pseudomonas protegens]